jgi:hypothetical protein
VLLAVALAPLPAAAQTTSTSGRFEVGVGVRWTGGTTFDMVGAAETTPDRSAFQLFTSRSRLESAAGVDGRVGVRLTRILQVEGFASYSKPRFTTLVTGDFEGAPNAAVTEDVLSFAMGGGLTADLSRWRLGSRGVPFISAGGGYLRELHEGQTLVATGRYYYAGAGASYLFPARGGSRRRLGLRGDIRAVIRTGGVAVDERARVAPSLGASAFLRF